MNNQSALFSPLTLPNGQILKNRICKASMEENLSDPGQIPGQRLFNLYRQWAEGGAGLILTGNVMIAPDALTGPGGVVLQNDSKLEPFEQWAKIGKSGGGHIWMQINHPGRQVFRAMGEEALAPSAIALNMPGLDSMFDTPRALREDEILDIINRYANTAQLAEQAGFTGVQIHAAHGYLLSQFLSPLSNKRDDIWGGSLENRARMLFETVRTVRARVSPSFCVSVKMNSADFQKGGFSVDDAKWVTEQLNDLGLDLLELSGGSYESPAMQGRTGEDSTSRREAYFIDFARDVASIAKMPIMVTGGIRHRAVAEEALSRDEQGFGVSVLGIARAMAIRPDLPDAWQSGTTLDIEVPEANFSNKALTSAANMSLIKAQLHRLADGKKPKPDLWPFFTFIKDRFRTSGLTKRYRKWREQSAA